MRKRNVVILGAGLAGLYGYIIGDGHIHKKGYRIDMYINFIHHF